VWVVVEELGERSNGFLDALEPVEELTACRRRALRSLLGALRSLLGVLGRCERLLCEDGGGVMRLGLARGLCRLLRPE